MSKTVLDAAKAAHQASIVLATVPSATKDAALVAIADALIARQEEIFAANRQDLKESTDAGLPGPLLKRLNFDADKLHDVTEGLRDLSKIDDPAGRILAKTELSPGLVLHKVMCPIGVIGVVFESRPDALVQIVSLCLKSGNTCLLKGGAEALHTNRKLTEIMCDTAYQLGIPEGFATLLEKREDVGEMLSCDKYINLIIPRGSNEFVQYIMNHTRIPVMGHSDGICHTYVDASADQEMAVPVLVDAKTQYVSACNATETVLVNAAIAQEFLPKLYDAFKAAGVTMYGDEAVCAIIDVNPATENTFKTEYLDYAVSIKIVQDVKEAIQHINTYGSGHTDAILATDAAVAEEFLNWVDSADVFWNCSTRFSDGFRFGFGAEVGISTGKLTARGPVGLDGLMSYKYKLYGSGQTVTDFATGKRAFTHKKLQ